MVDWKNTQNAAGTAVSAANVDAAGSGDVLGISVASGGSATYDNAGGVVMAGTSGASVFRLDTNAFTARRTSWARSEVLVTDNPTGVNVFIRHRSSSANLPGLQQQTDGTWGPVTGSSAALLAASPVLTAGRYLLDQCVIQAASPTTPTTSNGRIVTRIRSLTNPSTWNGGADWAHDTGPTTDAGTADLVAVRFGKQSGSSTYPNAWPSVGPLSWDALTLPAYDSANPVAAAGSFPAHTSDGTTTAPGGPTFPAIVPGTIAHIGDSTSNQEEQGAARMAIRYEQIGYPASKRFFYAVGSKAIALADSNGFTTVQNIDQARTALGGEAATYVIQLGSNGHRDGDSLNVQWINAVLDKINPQARIIWVGISQVTGFDAGNNTQTEATRLHWNDIAKPVVLARSNGRWADWDTYVKRIGDAGLWNSDGVHHTPAGYRVKNEFYADQVRPAYRRGRQLAFAG